MGAQPRNKLLKIALLAFVLLPIEAVHADDLRSAVQNPISSLISLPFELNFDNGADNGNANFVNIQPVVPVTVGNGIWSIV